VLYTRTIQMPTLLYFLFLFYELGTDRRVSADASYYQRNRFVFPLRKPIAINKFFPLPGRMTPPEFNSDYRPRFNRVRTSVINAIKYISGTRESCSLPRTLPGSPCKVKPSEFFNNTRKLYSRNVR